MSIEKIQAKLFLIPQLAQTFKGSVSKANVKTTSTTSRPKVTPRVQSNKVSLKSNVINDSFTVSTFSLPTSGFGIINFCFEDIFII